MSRGGRQKFGVDLIDDKKVRRVWGQLALSVPIKVFVVMMPASIDVIARHKSAFLEQTHDTELVGVYDMTIPLKDFMDDVRFAAEVMMRRYRKKAA